MSREIKFRFYRPSTNKIIYPTTGNFNDLIESEDWKVMQFTGKDKKGNEIYEGDVLQTPSGIGYMVFDNYGYAIKSPGSEAVDYEFSTFYLECEIIGNIYENPELLTNNITVNDAEVVKN